MIKIILQFTFLLFITASCSDSNVGNSAARCGSVSDLTITESNEIVTVNLVSVVASPAYEIMVASSSFQQIGSLHTMNQVTKDFTLAELDMETGNTYVLYARSTCDNNSYGDWSHAKTLVLD